MTQPGRTPDFKRVSMQNTDSEPSTLRTRLQSGKPAIGSFILGHDPGVARVAAAAGLHFLLLDNEHGTVTDELIAQFIDVSRGLPLSLVVRTTLHNLHSFARWFDHGLHGIIVAGAQSADDVRDIIATVKFPPLGKRGLNPFVPATEYGRTDANSYMAAQNDMTNVWVMAENQRLLSELDEICQLPGLDGIFFGPYDLSVDVGVPGQVSHPLVANRISEALEVIRSHGRFAGIYAKDTSVAESWHDKGVSLLAVGFDWFTLREAWAEAAQIGGNR